MNKTEILEKLKKREPLFTVQPRVQNRRIMGTENEYGVDQDKSGEPIINESRLPATFLNGGEAYVDCKHVEYCSPESSNAVSAVIYHEAGKSICHRCGYSPKLYCTNNDWYGKTHGAHENYFTCAPRDIWFKLVPFLVCRTVFIGSGWYTIANTFELSQRASHIKEVSSLETTFSRGLINKRIESLSAVKDWDRMHIICGDANMCEIALFLKLAITSLVLEMLELGALPVISYNNNEAVADLRAISRKTKDWMLQGVLSGSKSVVEVLSLYACKARELFFGRDEVTDTAIIVVEDTLEKLATNPMSLVGRLDWVTKLDMLTMFREKNPGDINDWLRSQDLQYHDLDPKEGLYYFLKDRKMVARLITDRLIEEGISHPPMDTRAYIRGRAVGSLLQKKRLCLTPRLWNLIRIFDAGDVVYEQHIVDPLKTYAELLPRIQALRG